jgi:hypothetical protein
MKKLAMFVCLTILALPAGAVDLTGTTTVVGDYLEARTAEVFVGHCLANSETGLVGQEAVMAWRVRDGSFAGVELEGLSVVAVVEGTTTLGNVAEDPVRGRSVIVVDAAASRSQRDALVALVRDMAGLLVDEIVAVETAPIEVELAQGHGLRAIRVGDIAAVEVRPRRHDDGLCGNEALYYPPLVELEHSHTGYTLVHEFQGTGLSSTWRSPGKSSAFVGSFVR